MRGLWHEQGEVRRQSRVFFLFFRRQSPRFSFCRRQSPRLSSPREGDGRRCPEAESLLFFRFFSEAESPFLVLPEAESPFVFSARRWRKTMSGGRVAVFFFRFFRRQSPRFSFCRRQSPRLFSPREGDGRRVPIAQWQRGERPIAREWLAGALAWLVGRVPLLYELRGRCELTYGYALSAAVEKKYKCSFSVVFG